MVVHIIISAIASILAVHWLFAKVLRLAKQRGVMDNPGERKLQSSPVPVLGGIAVFWGLFFGLLCYLATDFLFGTAGVSVDYSIIPVLLGACILLYIGALDDIIGLSPVVRLIVETIAMLGLIFASGMCVDSFHGLWGVYEIPWIIAVPLTVFAGVGIINAYNMVDGVNGLSSGLCILSSSALGFLFVHQSNISNAVLAFCFAAALFPFFIHNVFGRRSKMFIGDAGTMVMGFLFSWFTICTLSGHNEAVIGLAEQGNEVCLVSVMLSLASVPVFDALRVMVMRMLKGTSPFKADKTHLHHMFIAAGVSHFITSISECFINMAIFAAWFISYKCGMSQEGQLYITVAVAMLLVWGTYFFLSYQEKHHTKMFAEFNRLSRATHLSGKKWWQTLQRIVDYGIDEEN